MTLSDKGFKQADSTGYHLSLEISPQLISCCVLEIKSNTYRYFGEWEIHQAEQSHSLEELFGKERVFQWEFRSLSASLVNPWSTLVPEALFDKTNPSRYLSFNHVIDGETEIGVEPIPGFSGINVSVFDKACIRTLKNKNEKFHVSHQSSILLSSAFHQYRNRNEKILQIHLDHKWFTLLLAEGKQLHFLNSFSYNTPEDLAYYTLFVCDQLNLNPEKTEVVLSGRVDSGSAEFNILRRYIRNIKLADGFTHFYISPALVELPLHRHWRLLNQFFSF